MEQGKGFEIINKSILEMENFSDSHFNTEIELMELAKFEGIAFHKTQHNYYNQKVEEIKKRYLKNENDISTLVESVNLLWEWFTDHMLKIDRLYIESIKSINKKL